MSAKLIIWIAGKPLLNGHKQREFIWDASHGCYIYGGKEIDAADFNDIYEKAVRNNSDMSPRVRVVGISVTVRAQPPIETPPPAPITTISAREITADEAEEVLQRERPDRLKKKTGPKDKTAIMDVA